MGSKTRCAASSGREVRFRASLSPVERVPSLLVVNNNAFLVAGVRARRPRAALHRPQGSARESWDPFAGLSADAFLFSFTTVVRPLSFSLTSTLFSGPTRDDAPRPALAQQRLPMAEGSERHRRRGTSTPSHFPSRLNYPTLIPPIQPDSGAGRALRDALDKAGIDNDTPEISRTPKEQSLYRMGRMPLSCSSCSVGASS